MGLNKAKTAEHYLNAGGNTGVAMVSYIADVGCNGFKCKSCPLGIVCNHRPEDAKDYAARVMVEIVKLQSSKK